MVKLPDVSARALGTGSGPRSGLRRAWVGWLAALPVAAALVDQTAPRLPVHTAVSYSIAAADVDGDGDADLAVANAGQSRLYQNQGTGVFIDVTAAQLPSLSDTTVNALFLDADGDGKPDLLLVNAAARHRLLINNGTGTFVDQTDARLPVAAASGMDAGCGDVDGDGDTDIVLAVRGAAKRLLLNNGAGVFTDATANRLPADTDLTQAVVLADVDRDGDLDLVLLNRASRSRLLLNDGRGGFTEAAPGSMPDGPMDCQRGVAQDVDEDGDVDLIIGAGTAGARLLINDGTGRFADETAARLPALTDFVIAPAAGDVDYDGHVDIVLGCAGQDRSLLGNGAGGFTTAPPGFLPADDRRTFGVALVDVDRDFDLDLLEATPGGQCRLLLNEIAFPRLRVTAAPNPSELDTPVTVTVLAADQDGIRDLSLTIGGVPVALTNGVATFTAAGVGVYPLVASATDNQGNSAATTLQLTVAANLPPVVNAGPNVALAEGGRFTSGGSFTDQGTRTWSATVDYGEGAGAQALALNADKTFVLDHPYPESGAFRVTVSIDDGVGGVGTDTVLVTVANVPPSVAALPDFEVTEGWPISISGSFTDPGADTWTASVNYGDGTGDQPLALAPDKSFTLDHTFADNASVTVTVTVRDDDGGTGTGVSHGTVINVVPAVAVGPDETVTEGTRILRNCSFDDPGADTWTATVDHGDGAGPQALAFNPDHTFVLDHIYTDEGTFTLTVVVRDDDGGEGANSAVITVTNVAPTVDLGADAAVNEGSPFTRTVTFTDPGTENWSASVNYGDGTGSSALAVNADRTFALSHTYTDEGTYTVTAILNDGDGGIAQDTMTVTVANVAPGVDAGPDSTVTVGVPFERTRTFTDPGSDVWTATVNYGDGGGVQPLALTNRSFTLSHTYAAEGNYTVTVSVSDGDGGVTADSFLVSAVLAPDITAPTVELTVDKPDPLLVGHVVGVTVTATDDREVTSRTLTINGLAVPLDGAGRAEYRALAAGPHTVEAVAADAAGNQGTANTAFTVGADTVAPVVTVTTNPATVQMPGSVTLTVTATDNVAVVSRTLRVALPDARETVTLALDANGRAVYQPPRAGTYTADAQAADYAGNQATAQTTFDAVLPPDTEPPLVQVTLDPHNVAIDNPVTITVNATDNIQVVSRSLTVSGEPVELDQNGTALFTPAAVGTYPVVGRALDARGNQGSATDTIHALDPTGDTSAPTVAITAPAADAAVAGQVSVTGTASDPNLAFYTLATAPVGTNTFTTAFTGYTSVTDGALGTLDTSLMLNGIYDVRLFAQDVNGRNRYVQQQLKVEGEAKIGVVQFSVTDMTVPVMGIPITITRSYDSRVTTKQDFGVAWSLDVRQGTYTHNRTPGEGWEVTDAGGWFPLPCKVVNELSSHYTEIRLSDREYYYFAPTLEPTGALAGGCTAQVHYEYVDGWMPGATLEILGNDEVLYQAGYDVLYDFTDGGLGDVFNPRYVRLRTADGRVIDLDRDGGITRIADTNGNTLTISDGGITHSNGQGVTFTRDGQGRITAIRDPMNQTVQYAYDAQGRLISVTNQLDQTTQYVYSTRVPQLLEKIIGPDGREIAALRYDGSGRLVGGTDATGRTSQVVHDLAGRRERFVDATGRSATFTYDDRGSVTSATDALGNTTTYQYDVKGRLTRTVDALGRITDRTYDANGKVASIVRPHPANADPADYTTAFSYNARGQLASVTAPSGARLEMSYDAQGNFLEMRDQAGALLEGYSYGAGGVVTAWHGPFGTTTATYDAGGNPTQTVDRFGRTSTFVHDAKGRMTGMTGPDGIPATFQYDGLDRQTVADFGQGLRGEYTYGLGPDWVELNVSTIGRLQRKTDANGQLGGWVMPDGATSSLAYDASGRLTSDTSPGGAVTQYLYDDAGRLSGTRDALGAESRYRRDAVGRVVETIDPLGNTTRFGYSDGCGSDCQGSLTDARGNNWLLQHTPTSTAITDPLGRQSTFVTSPLGLPTQILWPDGTRRTATYLVNSPLLDGGDYPTTITDEGGHVRTYGYTATGLLQTATDLGGAVYTYGYDGPRLASVRDPLGDTVLAYSYTAWDAVETVTYADAGVQRFAYGADRSVTTLTRPSGATVDFEYDAAGRVSHRLPSSGDEVRFSWTAEGDMASMTDAAGVTRYLYDAKRQLLGIDHAGGATVRFDRDLLGRVTRYAVRARATAPEYVTTYQYDGVGNLVRIVDPTGGETVLTYDAANRLTRRQLPDGVTSAYTYDLRDRVTGVVHTSATGTVLASVLYDRRASGEPQKITREDGSYVLLDYDSALRLTRERRYDAADALVREIAYAYDNAGNRTTVTDESGPHAYTYASGYRLTAVAGPGDQAFTYDTDGRVSSVTRGGTTIDFGFDATDRMRSATDRTSGARVDYAYDGNGRRTGVTRGATASQFILGPTMGDGLSVPHLVTDADGNLVGGFVYAGDQPLLRFGPGGTVYYLTDSLDSVLALADASGAQVARFEYDGFGNITGATGPAAAPAAGMAGDFRYHGLWRDGDTGLYYVQTRYYDPLTGRFLSRDPVEPNLQEPESAHPYAFAYSNPQLFRDPTGAFTIMEFNIALNMQTMLRAANMYVRHEVKEYVREKIGEALTKLMFSAVEAFIPAMAFETVLRKIPQGTSAEGDLFEDLIRNYVCAWLEDLPFADIIWSETRITEPGEVQHEGYSCRRTTARDQTGDLIVTPEFEKFRKGKRPGKVSPVDFVVSPDSPAKSSPKAYVVGDIKLTVTTIVDKMQSGSVQWPAMANYAKKHAYRTVLYIALRGKHRPGDYGEISRRAWDKKVVVVVVAILNK